MSGNRSVTAFAGLALAMVLALALGQAAGRPHAFPQMPGPLSASHEAKPGPDCAACHSEPGKISPAKCLHCHAEIASRIASHRGFHRDKAEDCGTCHAEHQGRDAKLVPLDPADFDHSETGAVLEGAHLRIDPKSCETCHAKDRVLPRQFGRSYLLKTAGCGGCHPTPHPGREDNCLACHNQVSWFVGRVPREN